jgi:CspA family cold shock protein
MPTGIVTFYTEEDGYGFIETDAADDDVFFHVTDVPGPEPEQGDTFEFEIEQGDRGPRATNIRRG